MAQKVHRLYTFLCSGANLDRNAAERTGTLSGTIRGEAIEEPSLLCLRGRALMAEKWPEVCKTLRADSAT